MLAACPVPVPEQALLPFAVRPKAPLVVPDMMRVMRDHYEDCDYEPQSYAQRPAHKRHTSTICGPYTNSSSIFQLRAGMPVEIGAVWWLALWQPCSTPYLPLYAGVAQVPEELRFSVNPGNICPACEAAPDFGPAYQAFSDLARWVDQNYAVRIVAAQKKWQTVEQASFAWQKTFETYLLQQWRTDPLLCQELLSRSYHGALSRAMQQARTIMQH